MRLEYFQMLDRFVEVKAEERWIRAESKVPMESPVFEGHFPGYPLMPGVLLIEAMAQTSGWLLIATMNFERMPFLAAVKEAKMRRFINPGEKLQIDARLLHDGSGYAMTEAKIRVDGKLACNATLTFSHIPFPNTELRGHMEAMARKIGFNEQAANNG